MIEKFLAIFYGFVSAMNVYAGIGYCFTRKNKLSKKYKHNLILFLSILVVSIIVKLIF